MNTRITKPSQGKIGAGAGFLAFLLVAVNSVYAENYTWNVVSGTWDTATNWAPNGVPGAGDNIDMASAVAGTKTVAIGGVGKEVAVITKTGAPRWDIVGNSATLSTLSIQSINLSTLDLAFRDGTGGGGLELTVGNITVNSGGRLAIGTNSLAATNMVRGLSVTGTTNVLTGGLLNPNISNASANTYGLGLLKVDGGTVNLNKVPDGKGAVNVNVTGLNGSGGLIQNSDVAGATNSSKLIISNALDYSTATILRSSQVAGATNGELSIEKNGVGIQTLTGSNTYTGTTDILGGALLVNGTHTGGGAYTIGAGGTLGGTGSIGASNVTFSDGARLSPGASVEDLTLNLTGTLDISAINSAGSLLFELDTVSASDRVILSAGTLNIGTLNFSEFNFTALSGFGSGVYTLFDASTSIVGTIGLNSGALGAFSGVISIDDFTNDVILTVTAIPEPGAYAVLVGMSALGLCFVRRNARR